jgi:hypothetical protein
VSGNLAALQQRASAGDPSAQYDLGARLLVGSEAPCQPTEAYRLLNAAGEAGDVRALKLNAVLAAIGVGRVQNWADAYALVARAAARGDEDARSQIALLGAPFDAGTWLAPPSAATCLESPRVAVIRGFVQPEICAWIIEKARPRLSAARIKNADRGGANTDEYRSNTGMGFSVVDTDLVLQLVYTRVAAAIGIPVSHQEPANVLHYAPGEQYRPHYDYLDPGVGHFHRELAQIGQRIVTFLIYLNDDYQGGETVFTRLDWGFKGKTGDALIFWNVTPDGRPDPQTLHTGSPPIQGEKWLFSKWVRSKPVPLI